MQKVVFEIKTITPLFLAGADQEKAELRAPSFRGLMRYWHRALVGGIVGANEKTLPQVMEAETTLFGATDKGSAVNVKVFKASQNPQQYQKEGYSRASSTGKDYLLWSMAESGRGKPDKYRPDRLYYPQNTTFEVTISSNEDNSAKLPQAVAAFWLLTHLGGIGSRSRRCAGSLAVQKVNGDSAGFHFDTPQNVESLQKQLLDGIAHARQATAKNLLNQSLTPISYVSFDALAQKTCNIWILYDKKQSWPTSDIAMRALGASLQSYRSGFALQDKEVFGLPLGRNTARRASPLLLRVAELKNGGYAGVAVLFKTGNIQRYSLIDKWANSFSGKDLVTF